MFETLKVKKNLTAQHLFLNSTYNSNPSLVIGQVSFLVQFKPVGQLNCYIEIAIKYNSFSAVVLVLLTILPYIQH